LPRHHLVFNSIGDADLCGPALEAAVKLVEKTTAPIINSPERVLHTSRLENAKRLAGEPGVRTPETRMMPKEDIIRQQKKLSYPLLLRAPGFHTGQHFVKVDDPSGLTGALAPLPGHDILVMQYLEGRDAGGYARKYRVMMIGNKLYPLHLAVSKDWKVHYFTAAMAGQPQFQAEEKRFLNNMHAVLGPSAVAALEAIKDRLGLDYGGIDFGLDTEGNVLLFEANATMVINPPPPEERWIYRRTPIEQTLQAVRDLLKRDTIK
jgi:glutathione synthase/RimK-type ligase-like ATP-grasp enzyme